MDTKKQIDRIKTTSTQLPPAQLWIGPHHNLVEHATIYLQKILCKNKGCNTCNTCIQIRDQQHHAIIWLYPEKKYTLDQIDVIFNTISFALENKNHFFFVIQKADFLPAVCANRLLKPIEEPPTGYHFLLLAERSEHILPTIRSRCMSKSFYSNEFTQLHEDLFNCFTSTKKQSPIDFMKLLQTSKINERESVELMDMLLKFWIKKYKNSAKKNATASQEKNATAQSSLYTAARNVEILKKHILLLPMPGSSKLFWKNLFLQIHM